MSEDKLREENVALKVALRMIRIECQRASFGAWRHKIAGMVDAVLPRGTQP